VPTFFSAGASAYGRQVGMLFLIFYGLLAVVALAAPLLRDIGAVSAGIDRLLITFPLIGDIRRSFALSRFCTVYGLQLDAGINVIDSVLTAGRSSRSGLVRSA